MVKNSNEPVIKKIIRDVVREEIKPIENRLDSIENKIDKGFDIFLDRLEKYFFNFRSDMAKIQDKIVGEIQNFREENTILELKGQHHRLIQAEEEIENLKNIHPKNQHLLQYKMVELMKH